MTGWPVAVVEVCGIVAMVVRYTTEAIGPGRVGVFAGWSRPVSVWFWCDSWGSLILLWRGVEALWASWSWIRLLGLPRS